MASAGKKKKSRPKSISAGRPKVIVKPTASHSAKATRTTIRTHHQLNKALANATATGNSAEADRLQALILENGGLKAYQAASITGQSNLRGGDSSKVLVDWLREGNFLDFSVKRRVLEVGALSTKNVLSTCGFFEVERIDLESQEKGITKQDFMQRPLPRGGDDAEERFDMISLSLVLNYVPDAVGRGEMLKRLTSFLRFPGPSSTAETSSEKAFPCLFFVLPAPCVTNSRYMNEEHLENIMKSLGFQLYRRKVTTKLVYYIWRWQGLKRQNLQHFAKTEVNPGKVRNNFAVIIDV